MVFPIFLDKDTWPANSPDLNYCIRDEFSQAINWDKVTSKSSLIAEFKRSVKKFRLDDSFISHNTKLYKLFKRIYLIENRKTNLFKKRILILIKVFTRYCENRKRIIYSETPDKAAYNMLEKPTAHY